MKRSICLLAILAPFFASAKDVNLDALHHGAHFVGSGYSVDATNGGQKTSYKADVRVQVQNDGSKSITTTIETANEVMSWTKVIVKGNYGTYFIFDEEGKPVGNGYCVPKVGAFVCHSDLICHDKKIEETIYVDSRGTVSHLGSAMSVDATARLYWTDRLKRVKDIE